MTDMTNEVMSWIEDFSVYTCEDDQAMLDHLYEMHKLRDQAIFLEIDKDIDTLYNADLINERCFRFLYTTLRDMQVL